MAFWQVIYLINHWVPERYTKPSVFFRRPEIGVNQTVSGRFLPRFWNGSCDLSWWKSSRIKSLGGLITKRLTAHVTDTRVRPNLRSIYSNQDKNHSGFWILEPSKEWLVIKEHVTNIFILCLPPSVNMPTLTSWVVTILVATICRLLNYIKRIKHIN